MYSTAPADYSPSLLFRLYNGSLEIINPGILGLEKNYVFIYLIFIFTVYLFMDDTLSPFVATCI